MYFSANYINVKLNQDYADFVCDNNRKVLILCDGIGEFKDSGLVAKIVVEQYLKNDYKSLKKLVYDEEIQKLKANTEIKGGTTFITALNEISDSIKIEYLGNGGVIHLYGDFITNSNSEVPYRYVELMNPHINPNGALTRHISHNSGKEELKSTKVELNLNFPKGDIILLYSDGIASLEDKLILKDGEGRFWRNESAAIQFILNKLNEFLASNFDPNTFQENLIEFNNSILQELKNEGFLEDDASLGIIITNSVLEYNKSKKND